MQIVKDKIIDIDEQLTGQSLQQAFSKFTEASEKLQSKYEHLSTEAHDLRLKLAEKEIEVKRSERLATLGETATALAHEIRNPLGAITLYTSLLKQDLNDLPDSFELVQNIEKSAERLNQVVSNILRFTKTSELVLTPINIHSVLIPVVQEMKSLYPQITFETVHVENPFILGCALGLEQVFRNLLLNSSQAMKESGRVIIVEEYKENELTIQFRDSGPGMKDELLKNIFEPFVTTRNEGTGLGLAIVKQIMEQHAGSIRARNTSSGAEFVLHFPKKNL